MSIQAAALNGGYVEFNASTALNNLNTMSVLMWLYLLEYQQTGFYNDLIAKEDPLLSPRGWGFNYYNPDGNIIFYRGFSSSSGMWGGSASLSLNTNYHIAVTYDKTATTNDPVIYRNGSSVSLTEISTPAGTVRDDSSYNIRFAGSQTSGPYGAGGRILSVCIYNRILSAAEIADAYNSRKAIPTYQGLVFSPLLLGASGGVGDGDTLTSSNKIVDGVSGAYGTPAGSTVLRADTYLYFGE